MIRLFSDGLVLVLQWHNLRMFSQVVKFQLRKTPRQLKRVDFARCPTAVRLGAQSDTVLEAVSIKQKFSETQRRKEWIYY